MQKGKDMFYNKIGFCSGNITILTRSLHDTGERPYICTYCGKGFANHGNQRAHIQQAHLGQKRNYQKGKRKYIHLVLK